MQRFLLYIFSFNVRAGEQRGKRRKRTRRKTKRSAYQSVAEISCFVSSILWDKLSLSNAGEWHGTTQESKAVTSEFLRKHSGVTRNPSVFREQETRVFELCLFLCNAGKK